MAQSAGKSSKGSIISVAAGSGATKTITAITKANPGVVTSNAHGFLTGDVVLFASVGGMIELNGKYALIEKVDANSYRLVGTDTTNNTTYTSGGTAAPQTWYDICEAKSFTPSDPGSAKIDKTTICSDAKENVAGFPDEGTIAMDFNWVPADAALSLLWDARDAGAELAFRIRHTQFTPIAYQFFKATVNRLPRLPTIGVNAMLAGSGELTVSGKAYTTTAA